MPLSRPRANSLQLSVERIRLTSTWYPSRPPTPRRATYPQPGTSSLNMAGTMDIDIPPVPPLSYWEPETPSPASPYNPFLSPPVVSPDPLKTAASPLLPASPLSIFDRQITPKSSSFLFPRSSPGVESDLSPQFLNPRTPPPPPTMKSATALPQCKRRHSTISVPHGEFEKMQYQSVYDVLMATRDTILEGIEKKKEKELGSWDKGSVHCYTRVKSRRERRNMVRMKEFPGTEGALREDLIQSWL